MNSFSIILSDKNITQADAHSDLITDIEHTVINGTHYFFTCSLDSTVKAWTVAPDQSSLIQFAVTPLPARGLTM